MAVYFDSRGRALTPPQLAAIFAGGRSRGISENDLNKKKVITSLNDEIKLAQSQGENDYKKAVDKALSKFYPTKKTEDSTTKILTRVLQRSATEVNPAILSREERERLRKNEPVRVIDLIRKISVSNGISHVEARRILESSNVIPTGIADEAIIKPSKPVMVEEIYSGKRIPAERAEVKPRAVSNAVSNEVIRRIAERQKELERKQKILGKIQDLEGEKTNLLLKNITGAEPESPLPPGLALGSSPLQKTSEMPIFRQQERIDSPAKLANAIESRTYAKIQSGIPSDIARDQARREVYSLMQRNG